MTDFQNTLKNIFEAFQNAKAQIINSSIQIQDALQDLTPDIGEFGEDLTAFALTGLDGTYQVLRNLYVPYKEKTSEIDLVMVHEKGIFVFESKNYSGWIFGSAEQQEWTQCLPNQEKHRFYNPVRQNQTHIAALAEYLKIPRNEFFSYIVFSERCELKKVPENTKFVVILNRDQLHQYLSRVLSILPPVYNPAVVKSMSAILHPLTIQDREAKKKHVETVRASVEQAKYSNVCPRCGRTLMKRNGKYGEFWGCSGYPTCKFTKPMERS